MIAKLIVHGQDRPAAVRKLSEALAAYQIVGVTTNVAFLSRVVAHDAFASGRVDTGLIARHHATLFPPPSPMPDDVLVAAALAEASSIAAARRAEALASGDPYSPWHVVDSWWPGTDRHAISLSFSDAERRHEVAVRGDGAPWRVTLPSGEIAATVEVRDRRLDIVAGGAEFHATVVPNGEERHVFGRGTHRKLLIADPLAHAGEEETQGGHLTAPMSGTVVAVPVKAGETVERGAPLVILEAMKMEHTIVAPAAGVVAAVHYRAGDRVAEGAALVDLDPA
jgi:3-methylcrotonyl-CoA carboxylase alpha subunit